MWLLPHPDNVAIDDLLSDDEDEEFDNSETDIDSDVEPDCHDYDNKQSKGSSITMTSASGIIIHQPRTNKVTKGKG